MPLRKVPGGYASTYGGTTRTFKTKAAAERYVKKYKAAKTNTRAGTPRRNKKSSMTKGTQRTTRGY